MILQSGLTMGCFWMVGIVPTGDLPIPACRKRSPSHHGRFRTRSPRSSRGAFRVS